MSEARLHVSDSQGRRVVVLDRPLFVIGRRTSADLQIVSTDVSREHAEIALEEGRMVSFLPNLRGDLAVFRLRKKDTQ